MKVKELIELLESCDLETEVFVHIFDDQFKPIVDAFEAQDDNNITFTIIE